MEKWSHMWLQVICNGKEYRVKIGQRKKNLEIYIVGFALNGLHFADGP